MTKVKKRKSSPKSQENFDKYNEILGIIFVGLGLLILISLFSSKMGIFGRLIDSISFSLFGLGAYIFPLGLLFLGLYNIIKDLKKFDPKIYIILTILFLALLVVLDTRSPLDLSFIERIEEVASKAKNEFTGGIVGSIFGFFFYKIFGSIGTYIIVFIIVLMSLRFLFDFKIGDLLKKPEKKVIKKAKKTIEVPVPKTDSSKEIQIINYGNKFPQENPTKVETNKAESKKEDRPVKDQVNPNEINKELKEGIVKTPNNNYKIPSISFLKSFDNDKDKNSDKEIMNNAKIIEETLGNFGIEIKVQKINIGPTITCYELEPPPGIRLNKIVSLADNIALSLASSDIRIEAPIPGKSAVGIEVPNKIKSSVSLREVILSSEYEEADSNLPLALGKDVAGNVIVSAIDKMPHLLIAGATGSGKSVCINTIIMSILYKSSPDDVKLLLIDPKVVELSIYNGIPHLLIPVVTEAKKAAVALNWAVEEMETRYKTFAKANVRDITSYNNKIENEEEKMSKMVIIIDELADLMMVAANEIEDYICRLAQMARAAGIHLIVATQRPSVDVITGTIKANIPSRISFAVSSQIDSRTILDMGGAEKLLGKGDMLFYPSFYSKPARIQGAFISEDEVEAIVNSLKSQEITEYDEEIINIVENQVASDLSSGDDLFNDAVDLVFREELASISLLQRRLKIGYNRAARLIDEMEEKGIVSGFEGSKPRKVLISSEEYENLFRSE